MIVKYEGCKSGQYSGCIEGKGYIVISLSWHPAGLFVTLRSEEDGTPILVPIADFEIVKSQCPSRYKFISPAPEYYRLEPEEFGEMFWDQFHDGDPASEKILFRVMNRLERFHGLYQAPSFPDKLSILEKLCQDEPFSQSVNAAFPAYHWREEEIILLKEQKPYLDLDYFDFISHHDGPTLGSFLFLGSPGGFGVSYFDVNQEMNPLGEPFFYFACDEVGHYFYEDEKGQVWACPRNEGNPEMIKANFKNFMEETVLGEGYKAYSKNPTNDPFLKFMEDQGWVEAR